jgi:Thrombospondin type 3 repeat
MRQPFVAVMMVITAANPLGLKAQRAGSVEAAGLGVWHNKTTVHDGLHAFGIGARIGVWLPKGFEIEAQLDRTQPTNWASGGGYGLLNVGGAALYNYRLPSGASIYGRVGYSKLNASAVCRIQGFPCNTFGSTNFSLGARVPLSGLALVRAEGMVRVRPAYSYTSFGGSVGIAIITGGQGSATTGADDDADGVPNKRDKCKATPRGALVDTRGCPTDSDGDGVFDGIDRCPNTKPGTPVDAVGCPVRKPN